MKKTKILTIILLILSIIVMAHLAFRMVINSQFMKKYEAKEFDAANLSLLKYINTPEAYIVHYNIGDAYYQNNNYEEAKAEFRQALDKKPPTNRICPIRTNLALSMLQLVNFDDEVSQVLSELQNIMVVLLANSCAKTNGSGKDNNSQKLYDFLREKYDEKEKEKTSKDTPSGDDDDGNNGGDDNLSGDDEQQQAQIERSIRDLIQKSQNSRNYSSRFDDDYNPNHTKERYW